MFNFTQLPRTALGVLKRLPLFTIALVVIFLLALAEGGFLVQVATERGCFACHVPAAAREAAAQGAHARVACLDCHRTQGTLSLLEVNMRAARNLAVQVNPFSDPDLSRAALPSDTCLSCHRGQIVGRLAVGRDVRMRHADVLAAGIPCIQCHAPTVHGASPISPALDHGSCSSCHDGTTAGIACDVCHLRDPKAARNSLPGSEAVLHREPGRQIHGMGKLDSCPTCHTRTFCKSCHGVELPHDLNSFPHLHGKEAVEASSEVCTSCHAATFCTSCHQIEMPHPKGFLKDHAAQVKKLGQATCARCHVSEDCESCHTAHIHPGLPPEVLQQLRSSSP